MSKLKSKRLIILISVFVFIALIVVLGSTVFTLKSVEIDWTTTRAELINKTDEQILDDIELPMGESIFLIQKQEIINKIEKNNPYIQVLNIETVAPDKLKVYSAERESLYAIKIDSNNYAVVDKELKVLKFISAVELSSLSIENKPVLLSVTQSGLTLTQNNFEIGTKANIENLTEILTKLTYSLQSAKYNSLAIRGFISNISINLNADKTITIKTRYGINIKIEGIDDNNLTDKLLLGLSVYETKHNLDITGGTITVFYSESLSKVLAVYGND